MHASTKETGCDRPVVGRASATVARHLVDRKDLTVATIAIELAPAEGVTVVVTGGMMRDSELFLIGHITRKVIVGKESR